MDYKAALSNEHSRSNSDRIVKAIGNDPQEFGKIMEIIYHGEPPLPQRASWVLGILSRSRPELIRPYLKRMIETVQEFKIDGIKRNMMLAIAGQEIPEKLRARLLDICLEQMLSPEETVAVKVWAMETAASIARIHPELGNELRSVIEDQLPKNSIAFSARAKKVLKKL